MSRVKRSVHARKKRRKVLKEAKGYFGRKHSSYRFAKEQVQRSGMYAYRDRRNRKRDFRRLWITRINAAARLEGMSYSRTDPRAGQGRRRGEPQDARRDRGLRPRRVPPICGASPGGCGRLAAANTPLSRAGRENGPLFRSRRRNDRPRTDDNNDDLQPPKREAEAGPQAARAQAPRARGAVRDRGRGPARGRPGRRRRAALRPARAPAAAWAAKRWSRSCWPRSRRWARERGRSPFGRWRWARGGRPPASICTASPTPATSARSCAPPTRCSAAASCSAPAARTRIGPKAVRASMGSIFAQPLAAGRGRGDPGAAGGAGRPRRRGARGAGRRRDALPRRRARGPARGGAARVRGEVTIPLRAGGAESLNVAAAAAIACSACGRAGS